MNNLKKLIQSPSVIRFKLLCQSLELYNSSILLTTLPRSGTHYARALIANYLLAIDGKSLLTVDKISRIHSCVFERDLFNTKSLTNPISPSFKSILKSNDASNIIRTHQPYHKAMKSFKKLHLYREPFGFFESYLVYMYIKRGHSLDHQQVFSIIDKHFLYYESMLLTYTNVPNCLRLDFDDLMLNPKSSLRKMGKFFGFDTITDDKIQNIIDICSIQRTQSRENLSNPINIDSRPLDGSFINNGQVRVINDEHRRHIKYRVNNSKISQLFQTLK